MDPDCCPLATVDDDAALEQLSVEHHADTVYTTAVRIIAHIEELQARQDSVVLQGTKHELRLTVQDEYIDVQTLRQIVVEHTDIKFSTAHGLDDGRAEVTVSLGSVIAPWVQLAVETNTNLDVNK